MNKNEISFNLLAFAFWKVSTLAAKNNYAGRLSCFSSLQCRIRIKSTIFAVQYGRAQQINIQAPITWLDSAAIEPRMSNSSLPNKIMSEVLLSACSLSAGQMNTPNAN